MGARSDAKGKASTPASWHLRLRPLRRLPAFLGLLWEAGHHYAVATALLRITRAFVPIAALWVGKLILDTVLAVQGGRADVDVLIRYVAIEIVIVVAADLLARASAFVDKMLGDLVSDLISIRLMEHAAALDLEQLEDPAFYDRLERGRHQAIGGLGVIGQLFGIGQDLITFLTLCTALLTYNPWLAVLLIAGAVPSFLGETRFVVLDHALRFRWTPMRRQLNYLSYLGTSDRTVKEVKTFGLGPWLIERYRALAARFRDESRRLALQNNVAGSCLAFVATAAHYGAYTVILRAAVRGAISIGELTFLAAVFARNRDIIQRVLLSASDVYAQSLSIDDLFSFLDVQPRIVVHPPARPFPTPIREGFLFDNVGFRYRGNNRWALRHLTVRLCPGECIALVGANGAGKTTLTKLLIRLYDPTEGRIFLDGVDLHEYDIGSLRRAVSVLFQDFVPYAMRFEENVGIGHVEGIGSYLNATALDVGAASETPVPAAIQAAAERSLASTLLPRLPAGYRQMLGRHFDGGVALSGGEWQKVALARAYMRDSQIVILDEPTAALDARAEYEVFLRFSELVPGRLAILISHRFSTLRMADRILVLAGGTVLEEGTHDALVRRGGLYAELFNLQAERYR